MTNTTIDLLVHSAFFVAALLFIFGLKSMTSAKTARNGIVWAGLGMLIAVIATFLIASNNMILMLTALFSSSLLAWWSGRKVQMTAMPQMVALYNGMGGGAAGAIAALELLHHFSGQSHLSTLYLTIAMVGAIIGTASFSGSLIAFAKLEGWITKTIRFKMQHVINGILLLICISIAVVIAVDYQSSHLPSNLIILALFFGIALLFGIMMTLPIGGADMPVVISLYNGFTGLAVGLEGFVISNPAMIIAGTVVGAAGTLLTKLMADAMNRSISNVLFSNFSSSSSGEVADEKQPKTTSIQDVAIILSYSQKVIFIPGYGMAVAQAQHKINELANKLISQNIKTYFAIHPVAGRMPGHMNVLLAEAGIDYELILDIDEANQELASADLVVIVGANDVINPSARENPNSPIFGMPILNADSAKQVIVIKRGAGTGFSNIQNPLFTLDNCSMLYGDAQKVISSLNTELKNTL